MNNDIFIEPWIEEDIWDVKNFEKIKTPTYVVSEKKIEENLKILKKVQVESGCKILMALKSFSMFKLAPLIRKYLSGVEASSVNEAKLGAKEFGGEVHVFSPSYTLNNIKEYILYSDHLVFNSFSQWNRFKIFLKNKKISCGIRVNLEHSEADVSIYDPSRPKSQFGVTLKNFEEYNLDGIEGLHFHNLCELDADALERSIEVFKNKFGKFLNKMKWVNFGGGHHITRKGYNLDLLIKIIKDFKSEYPHLDVYLEPGEAIALNAGVLVGEVVDIFKNDINIAVLDVSATTHMPDVLEIPYLPTVLGAKGATKDNSFSNTYRLVGPSCLTGDIIGEYLFLEPLSVGQKIVFLNMAIYTMVKNNTFNGINLPSIALIDKNNKIKVVKEFSYRDFKNRLS